MIPERRNKESIRETKNPTHQQKKTASRSKSLKSVDSPAQSQPKSTTKSSRSPSTKDMRLSYDPSNPSPGVSASVASNILF